MRPEKFTYIENVLDHRLIISHEELRYFFNEIFPDIPLTNTEGSLPLKNLSKHAFKVARRLLDILGQTKKIRVCLIY